MLIYQASAPQARDTFLHAGYGSAYNDFYDFDPATYGSTSATGITQSGHNPLAVPEINVLLIMVFFGGLALLTRAKQVPRTWRWATVTVITVLLVAMMVLMYTPIKFAQFFS